MQQFVFILAIAAIFQVSLAGPLLRFKRSDEFVDVFIETVEGMKNAIPRLETLVENSLKDIPKTPAYAKYIELFAKYLRESKEYKNSPGNCFEKTVIMFEKFTALAEEMSKDDTTPEGILINKILENNGGEELVKDFEEWGSKLEMDKVENEIGDISPEDAFKMAPVLIEVC